MLPLRSQPANSRFFSSVNTASTKRTKLIVGLDYGTTYTGIAFVHSTASDFRDIKTFTAWPGGPGENHEHLEKAPSVFAYASENAALLDRDAWGYQVEAGMTSYSWTKLLLDEKALPSEDDDPGLGRAVAAGLFSTPKNKKAIDVVSDYLRAIYNMFMTTLEQDLAGSEILAVTPIEFWLTVPAIWSDSAKDATLTAARRAGFAGRPDDELYLIPEPEAAAHLALKSSINRVSDLVKPKSGVLVCDCGGGTVDITSYTVLQTEPTLVLEESSIGTGGKCGSTYIDRNLHDLLSVRYGEPFFSLPPERIGPGSRFMKEFETKKKDFRMTANIRKIHKLQLKIPEFEDSEIPIPKYGKEYAEVHLSDADMKKCFDPVVDKIIALLSAQVDAVREAGQPAVGTIVLVGGLGGSPHLREILRNWSTDWGIRLTTPVGPWSAVVRGAVLRGLEGCVIQKRMARRHYGYDLSTEYDPEDATRSDGTRREPYTDPWTGEKRVHGSIRWIVSKGKSYDANSEVSMRMFVRHILHKDDTRFDMDLFSCSLDEAPKWEDHERVEKVGTLLVDYPDLDFGRLQSKEHEGSNLYDLEMDVIVKLGAKDGFMTFRVLCQGREVGTADIDFSHT